MPGIDHNLIGRRVRMIHNDYDYRLPGMTGRLTWTEDGYGVIFERPLPEICNDYLAEMAGVVDIGEDLSAYEFINDDALRHSGIAGSLGPQVAQIESATKTGEIVRELDLVQAKQNRRPEALPEVASLPLKLWRVIRDDGGISLVRARNAALACYLVDGSIGAQALEVEGDEGIINNFPAN